MNARNPKYIRPDQGAIDLEYQHPIFGWIPYAAAPYDVEELGRQLYASALAGEFGPVTPYEPPPAPPVPSQFEADQKRYLLRAAVKDELIAWMAADNMRRVRTGVWTVTDLLGLVEMLSPINVMMQTLSFELAAQAIFNLQVPLMTAEIKTAWVAKLTEHFYLE